MSDIKTKQFKVDLQLFNDGGATGGAEGSAVATTENAPKTDVKPSGSSRRSKSGEFDNVVFGKQEGTTSENTGSLDTEGKPTGAGTEPTTPEDRRKAFDALINGEYKDLYEENFQKVFDRRFKQVKGLEADLQAQKPILDKLMARYGVEDVAQLDKALTEDTEYWERVAEERGMTVEQYMEKQRQDLAIEELERENAELRAIRQREEGLAQARSQVDAWYQEANKVKELYPSFDFKAECNNKDFVDMLKRGISVEHAYKTLHFDELMQNAEREAARAADARTQERIKQKASRPSENGTSSQSAAIVKNDVSKLNRKERAEIARRVARGEEIRF